MKYSRILWENDCFLVAGVRRRFTSWIYCPGVEFTQGYCVILCWFGWYTLHRELLVRWKEPLGMLIRRTCLQGVNGLNGALAKKEEEETLPDLLNYQGIMRQIWNISRYLDVKLSIWNTTALNTDDAPPLFGKVYPRSPRAQKAIYSSYNLFPF